MTLSRRDFLKLGALVSASSALAACTPVYDRVAGALPVIPWTPLNANDFLALNRLTFGSRVEERTHFAQIGLQAWIEEQLDFESIDDLDLTIRLTPFNTLGMDANELEGISNQLFDNYDRETVPNELRQAALLRQLYSKRQLFEVMADFWTDHFNIYIDKGNCFYLKTVDDREVIRKHALGSFHDLVWSSAHSPAMMVYLDNQANEKGAPNENYARELMELHTLSVNGGYTQTDVMELARCLTGWNVKEHFWVGDFVFKAALHDSGTKHVLGLTLDNDGIKEAEQVIELLVAHPSAARFISTKLARRFIADEPPQEIIDKAAQTFLQTKGDIKSILRVILLDGLALAQPKYKRPQHFINSALRMLNAQVESNVVHDHLLRMGQSYFHWPTPDGYPDRSQPWQGNLMPRWQFAFELIRDEIDGVHPNLNALLDAAPAGSLPAQIDSAASLLFGAPLDQVTRDELIGSVRSAGASDEETLQIVAGALLASPAFQWR